MKRFSDFNITQENKNIFPVPIISIDDIVNSEIEVIDFESNVTTRHGDGRYILKILFNGSECKFFTNASPIKEALEKIQRSDLPFLTIIKQIRFGGNKKTYQLT